jgi:branched-subunit amino acid aminotransferase/4-amino-4-deoxychorismate lyase
MVVFLNGKFLPEADAVVPVSDRGFLLGDGLFETTRGAGGQPFRLAQHLDRLARGAIFCKIHLPFTLKEIQKFAAELIAKNGLNEAVLRVTLTRGSGPRGYSPGPTAPGGARLPASPPAATQPTLVLTLHPLPPQSGEEPWQWSLITSSFRIPASEALAAFKSTSKILNVLARSEAEAKGADEALLLNANGEVAETASGNLFWVYQDVICTAPSGRGVLPGITRAVVLEICQALGLETNKRVIRPQMLRNATGIFVTQSALGIVPVAAFDGAPVAPSPLVDQIASAYNELLGHE